MLKRKTKMAMKKKGNANGGKKKRMMKAKGGAMGGKRKMMSGGGKMIKGPYS